MLSLIGLVKILQKFACGHRTAIRGPYQYGGRLENSIGMHSIAIMHVMLCDRVYKIFVHYTFQLLKACNFNLQHRCFPMNIKKFLVAAFL